MKVKSGRDGFVYTNNLPTGLPMDRLLVAVVDATITIDRVPPEYIELEPHERLRLLQDLKHSLTEPTALPDQVKGVPII